jgi:hypothetical protein
MDWRLLRSPYDVERNGLVRVAAKAPNFEIAVSSIECIAQRRRWLRRTLEAEHGSFHASTASRSASLRACVAHAAAALTDEP